MISVGDLVEDNDYFDSIGYVVGIVELHGINRRTNGTKIRNCHIKFFNDPDEETVVIEESRLTKVQ
jgi:hypothetical protein